MRFITLTTDWGTKDFYVATVKAQILQQCPDALIVDISHEIKPFNVVEAAFQISQAYKSFPEGTVHILGVDSEPIVNFGSDEGAFPSIMEFDGHYFVGNDNGFFGTLLRGRKPAAFVRVDDVLSNPNAFRFPTKNILVPAATKVFKNIPLTDIGSDHHSYKTAFASNPVTEAELIKGVVIHFDSFGNAITNIDRELFEQIGQNAPFILKFKESNDHQIDHISTSYNEVPEGEKVAIFSESGLLTIAINRGANNGAGGAQRLFGLELGSVVRIHFHPAGSKNLINDLFV